MKRNLFAFFLVLTLLIPTVFTACTKPKQAQPDITFESPVSTPEPAVMETPTPETTIDTDDKEMLAKAYLRPILFSSATISTWSNPEQLPPEQYINMFGYMNVWNQDMGAVNPYLAPQDEVEQYIQQYFSVSQNFLRSAKQYNSSKAAYEYNMDGVGWALDPNIVKASFDTASNTLLLFLKNYHDQDSDITAVLEIKIAEDGSFQYMGNVAASTGSLALGENTMETILALEETLDDSLLPLSDYSSFFDWEDSTDHLPTQLLVDTPEAYQYAQHIMNYLYFNGNVLEDFDGSSIYMPAVIQTALYRTTPIAWQWESTTGATPEYLGPFDDHVLSALIMRETYENRGITDLYYESDVQETIRILFGDEAKINNLTVEPFVYYPAEEVYGRIGDFGGPVWSYPILTEMTAVENGMICEVVLTYALDKETPLTVRNSDEGLTAENFAALTKDIPRLRYTFVEALDGRMILQSLQTIPATEE